jgi:hypothetical protein
LLARELKRDAATVGLFVGTLELSGEGYERVPATWMQIRTGLANAEPVEFATALSDWGRPTEFGVFDAAGRLLIRERLDQPTLILADDVARFDAGDLTIAITS